PVLLPLAVPRRRTARQADPDHHLLQALDGPRHLRASGLLLPGPTARGDPLPGARARRAPAALLPLPGGELPVGRQHPGDARGRVLLLDRAGAGRALLRRAAMVDRPRPRPRVVRTTGSGGRALSRLHAALGRSRLAG